MKIIQTHINPIVFAILASVLLFSACTTKETPLRQQEIKDINDLKGCSFAIITGSIQDLYLSQNGLDEHVLHLSTPADVLTALESGVADYTFVAAEQFVNTDIESRGIELVLPTEIGGNLAVAFNKEETELCQAYNAFLKELRASGELDRIFARWMTPGIDTVTMPDIPQPQGKPIIIATIGGNMPYSFIKDDHWAGIDIEMMQRFGQYVGRPVKFEMYDFSAIIATIATHKAQAAVAGIAATEERAQKVLFSDAYHRANCAFFGRKIQSEVTKLTFQQRIVNGFHNNFIQEQRWRLLLKGLWATIVITILSLFFGTILGGVLCFMRMRQNRILRGFAKAYINLMRGIPILVILMLIFYVVFASTNIPGTVTAIIAFTLNLAAYLSEMFRSGIESIDKGQTEAGLSLGFSKVKTFWYIVLPQAVKHIIPVYKGEAISLLKSTSIVGYIAIQDLTKASDIIRSRTFDAFYPLIAVSIIYLLLALLLGLLLDRIFKSTIKQENAH